MGSGGVGVSSRSGPCSSWGAGRQRPTGRAGDPIAPHGLAGRGVQRLRRLQGHAAVCCGAGRAEPNAERVRTAILGSEAVPWRCHRRLIADALSVRGGAVRDILGPRKVEPHALADFARVRDGRLTYPAEPLLPEG